MTAWQFVITTWPWEPSVVLGCAALAAGYLKAVRLDVHTAVWFFGGVIVLLLALVSPLDVLADSYLFSAHMLQHLLLLLIVPPLLLLGVPESVGERAYRWVPVGRLAGVLGSPAVTWGLGVGTMCVWHAPALYNAALESSLVHIGQHLSFLITGVIFWWPVAAPVERARMRPLLAMVYLLAAALASSLLGILLTFAQVGLYPIYLHHLDTLGIEPFLRDQWGLSPEIDQQVGGLLMWVGGGLVYLGAILGTLARWYSLAEGPRRESHVV